MIWKQPRASAARVGVACGLRAGLGPEASLGVRHRLLQRVLMGRHALTVTCVKQGDSAHYSGQDRAAGVQWLHHMPNLMSLALVGRMAISFAASTYHTCHSRGREHSAEGLKLHRNTAFHGHNSCRSNFNEVKE